MNYPRKSILLLGDICTLFLSFLITITLKGGGVLQDLWLPFSIVIGICIIALYSADLYDFRFIRPASSNLWRIAAVILISPILSIILFYFFDFFTITPRLTLVIFFVSFSLLFILWRRVFYKIFSNSFKSKTVIWGTSKTAEHLFSEIANNPHRGYEPLLHVRDLPRLIDVINNHHFQVLVIDNHLQLPYALIEIIFKKKVTVLSLDETYEEVLQKVPLETINETLFIQNIQNHNKLAQTISRGVEYIIALSILILTSPILLIMIIGIKIEDGGSILYKGNTRLGFLGKEFMLYKFRSMTEEVKRKSGQGSDWTEKNDSRITKVGTIIRKLHIDELAQMINVLQGDISLVGPRPDVTPVGLELKKNVPEYYLRHIVKPGFTGWAQIKYHAPASHAEFVERFQYDLYYIKHKEFFFNLGIMFRTLQIIFSHSI